MSIRKEQTDNLRFFSELVGAAMMHDPILMMRVQAVYERRRDNRWPARRAANENS